MSAVVAKGIDVSEHQGLIDWDKVKSQIDFAMIRAGYGKNHIDLYFEHNISECNRLGIPCGVYWFSYATNATEAMEEAGYCVTAIQPYKIDYPVCYDFEYDSANWIKTCGLTLTKELVTSMAFAFLGGLEAAGYYAMNYSNVDYLNNWFSSDTTSRFDLWLASWPNNVDLENPPRSCGIWQWGGATYDGINGSVDSNVSYKVYGAIQETEPTAEQAPAEVPAQPTDWKSAIADTALANGIITDATWRDKLDEPMPVWAVLKIACNVKGV